MDKYQKIVLGIFLVVLALRLWIAFTIPNFTYESYFHLRQAENIQKTGLPLYDDPLSYGGRTTMFLPLYDYLLAATGYVVPLEFATKVLSNILMALLVPLSFLIAREITPSKIGAVLAALISGFIPISFETNHSGTYALVLPLTFLAIYCIARINKREYNYLYLISFALLSLTSPITALFIWGLAVYAIISKIEGKEIKQEELEITIFSLFLFLWTQFLFFKNVLLTEGIRFLWQNIPSPMLSSYFQRLSIAESIVYLGIIPLVIGFWVMYKNIFRQRSHFTNLLTSFALGILFLLVFQAISLKISLQFLGVIFAILFSKFYHYFEEYIKKTKVDRYRLVFTWLIVGILIITSISPSLAFALQQETPTTESIEALQWVAEHTSPNSTVISSVDEGHLVNYVSKRKNVMDDRFVGIQKVEERFKDIERAFITKYQTEAIDVLNKYSVDYIYFSEKVRDDYNIEKLNYIGGGCFRHVYKNTTRIYKSECILEEINQS